MSSQMVRFACLVAWLMLTVACQGDGSDIGPKLDRLPDASSMVLVLDDTGRGIAGACVEVEGASTVTGRSGRGDLLANPRGGRLVTVDAAAASATASDRLASLTFRAEMPSADLPFAVYLPDTSMSGAPMMGPQLASLSPQW